MTPHEVAYYAQELLRLNWPIAAVVAVACFLAGHHKVWQGLLVGLSGWLGWLFRPASPRVRVINTKSDDPTAWVEPAKVLVRMPVSASEPAASAEAKGNGKVRVEPNKHPLWVQRGWQRQGSQLVGAFRTPVGSCSGVIELARNGNAKSYFILSPPKTLLSGGHGACFHGRGKGKFWIHFNRQHPDPDSGIVAVEQLLAQALAA